jgi:GntR family transcriptional repressor for pyruvate dehydrogenase complex
MADGHVEEKALNSTQLVVAHVRSLIERGELRPGDRLPPERDLATQIGVSRPTVSAAIRALAAMGVVQSRQGSGTYIPAGPPALLSDPLRFQTALHHISRDEVYRARQILEVGAAGLAAEHSSSDDLATMADEVASMFATVDQPHVFIIHDVAFHRAIANASSNQVIASLVDMVAALHYETRDQAPLADREELQDAADMHRRIYRAIRARDVEAARRLMHDHLTRPWWEHRKLAEPV